jgi:hypothetical protein
MGNLVSGIANIFTGADKTAAAGAQSAEQQRIAAEASTFRPVGMTTRFGSSQFTRTTDPKTGLPYISEASYQPSAELANLQNSLIGQFGGGFDYATALQNAGAPIGGAAQGLFGLGQQFLPTSAQYAASPEAQQVANYYNMVAQGIAPSSFEAQADPQAMEYANQLRALSGTVTPTSYDPIAEAQRITQQQQDLLAGGREQQLSSLRNQLFQTGRRGLATGGTTTGMQATNPEMAAYYNSIAQQDAQIAAGAQQQARANLQSDIGLGTALGGQALSTQQQAQSAAQQDVFNRLGLGLGYASQGLTTQQQAQELSRQQLYGNIAQGTGLLTTGVGLLGTQAQLASQAYSPLQTLLGVSSQVDNMAQMPYQLGIQLGQAQQPGQQAFQQGISQAAQTQYNAQAAANQANAGFWSGVIAGGAKIAASDLRLKENIKKVGVLPSGLNLYSYEYKPEYKDKPNAGYGTYIGVMAQEAEQLIPESVSFDKDGFRQVDYNLIH